MSVFSQFTGGSVPIGGYGLFSANEPNVLTLPDGKVFLKSGVLAKASDYPTVPAAFQAYINPLVPVSDIGSGGVWASIAIDAFTGLPYILNDGGGANLVEVRGTSATSSADCSMSGSSLWTYRALKIGSHRGWMIAGTEGNGMTRSTQLGNAFSGSFTSFGGASGPTTAIASNPNGNAVILRGGTQSTGYYATSAGAYGGTITLPSTGTWAAAAFGGTGSRFVALRSASSEAGYSDTAGTTWTASTMPAAVNWSAVEATASLFVAVASGGTQAATSADGITWTSRTLPVSANWSAVAYSSSLARWCAVASGSAIAATSSDGITWTQRTLPFSAAWCDVKWSPALGVFIAVASDGLGTGCAVSADGITWTSKVLPRALTFENMVGDGTSTLYAFRWTGTLARPTIAKSTDNGTTWTYGRANTSLGPGGVKAMDVKYLNGALRIAWSNQSNPSTVTFMSSTDGFSWTQNATHGPGVVVDNPCDMSWNGSSYVFVHRYRSGAEHTLTLTSTNYTVWTTRGASLSVAGGLTQVEAFGTAFVAVGTSGAAVGAIYRSTDGGATFTLQQTFVGWPTWTIDYDSTRSIGFISGIDNAVNFWWASFDSGATWVQNYPQSSTDTTSRRVNQFIRTGGGNTGIAYWNTTAYRAGDGQAFYTSGGATYSIGYTVLANRPLISATEPARAVVQGGLSLFTDGNTLLRTDTALYIDNLRVASEATTGPTYGQLNYYMRVK